jgi:hypothetical protein
LVHHEDKRLDKFSQEDVAHGDPREVSQETLQSLADERRLHLFWVLDECHKEEVAKLVNLAKLLVKGVFQLLDLLGGHLVLGEVENLLAE